MKQVIKQVDIVNHPPTEVFQVLTEFKNVISSIKDTQEIAKGQYYHYYKDGKEVFTIQVTDVITNLMVVFHFRGFHQEGTLSIQLAQLNENSTRIYFTSFFEASDYLGRAEIAFNRLAFYVDDIEANIKECLKNG